MMAAAGDELLIVVANFQELFTVHGATPAIAGTPDQPPHGHVVKAVLWPDQPGWLLLAPAAPDIPVAGSCCHPPAEVIVPTGLGAVTLAALDEPVARARLTAFCAGAARVRIMATVHSLGLTWLAAALGADRVVGLPACPAGLVRRWNTKLGGRDLALAAGIPPDLMPAQAAMPSLDHALITLKDLRGGGRWLLKPNAACGGFGLVEANGGQDVPERLLGELRGRRTAKASWKSLYDMSEPLVLQQFLGERERNTSLTADFEVAPDGAVAFLGVAQQRLQRGFVYQGATYTPDAPWRMHSDMIVDIGQRLGARMAVERFQGCYNLDFLVTPDNRLWLIELNVRRSAPLDQFLTLRRLVGPNWMDHSAFDCHEAFPITGAVDSLCALEDRLRRHRLAFHDGQGVLAFHLSHRSERPYAGLLVIGPNGAAVDTIRRRLEDVLHG
ncbi:hypothetical protein [Azospirillum griseum]|uniref:ATP-grasp domain-containing protein n=1 Tax=Azospirillum griseum TaxID=2496639 RepID=A0A431VAA7_9PROT|nr:hypothetical protein [Azospirillum griseum]RTR13450.1 hypothetical protein EJ903_24670 [Azospirillum griseum]